MLFLKLQLAESPLRISNENAVKNKYLSLKETFMVDIRPESATRPSTDVVVDQPKAE